IRRRCTVRIAVLCHRSSHLLLGVGHRLTAWLSERTRTTPQRVDLRPEQHVTGTAGIDPLVIALAALRLDVPDLGSGRTAGLLDPALDVALDRRETVRRLAADRLERARDVERGLRVDL